MYNVASQHEGLTQYEVVIIVKWANKAGTVGSFQHSCLQFYTRVLIDNSNALMSGEKAL